jgi:hypothetical protein
MMEESMYNWYQTQSWPPPRIISPYVFDWWVETAYYYRDMMESARRVAKALYRVYDLSIVDDPDEWEDAWSNAKQVLADEREYGRLRDPDRHQE